MKRACSCFQVSFHQPPTLDPIPASGHVTQLPAMRMAERAGQRVGRIRARSACQLQQSFHHFLHLFFLGVAVADHRLFDLQSRIFGHRQITRHRRADRRSPRLSQQQRRLRINVDEDLFHRHFLRRMAGNHFLHRVENILEPVRQFAVG